MGVPQPLLLKPGTEEFIQLDSSAGHITLSKGDQIELFCSKNFKQPFEGQTVVVSCVEGTQFLSKGKSYEFNKFVCTAYPDHSVKTTARTCIGGKLLEIGFKVKSKWLNLLEICHNSIRGETHWVHYKQAPENAGFQRNVARIGFIQGDLYKGLKVDDLYKRVTQRKTIAKILGSNELANQLIAATGDYFLSRGHLAAKSDFIYGSQQLATFYFINAAPQWQTFNAGNWAAVEYHLKKYVDKKIINVDIYTGTYGVVKFNDVNGHPRDLYLASDNKNTAHRIPVPKQYYKMVIDPKTRAGIVFLGVNNPYAKLEQIQKEYIICTDIGDKVKYIPWERTDLKAGYSYACEVSDFLKTVTHLPNLPKIEKLLL